MPLERKLSGETCELLETAGSVCKGFLEEEERRNYFLSEGTGMELWERLKAEGFSPEELEEAKRELKNGGLLSVRKVENAPPYYYRFYGKLAGITDYIEHRNEELSPGHATITYTEKKERLYIDEKVLRKEKQPVEAKEIVEKALELYKKYKEDRKEAIKELVEEGLQIEDLREIMEMKEGMELDDFDQAVEGLVNEGLAERSMGETERRRCVYFVSEWSERGDEKTRFFFSPKVYSEFLR